MVECFNPLSSLPNSTYQTDVSCHLLQIPNQGILFNQTQNLTFVSNLKQVNRVNLLI